MTYPHLDDVPLYLRTTIDLYDICVDAMHPGASRQPAARAEPDPLPEDGAPARNHDKGRTYKSVYVGVTTHNGCYVSQWGVYSRYKGSVHPLTPEGARLAAIDRAVALERDYLERRDGNHEPL